MSGDEWKIMTSACRFHVENMDAWLYDYGPISPPPPLRKKKKRNERWKVFTVQCSPASLPIITNLLRWCYNSSVLLMALDPYLTYQRWSSDFFMIKLNSCANPPTPFPFCGERSVGLQWFQFWFCHIGSLVCFEEIGGNFLRGFNLLLQVFL